VLPYQFNQKAFIIRRKVLDNNEREVGVDSNVIEKLMNGFKPTGRSTDCNDVIFLRYESFLILLLILILSI
jgi:hypothetical protein